MSYSQQQLDREVKRGVANAAAAPLHREGKNGLRKELSIPPRLYHQALSHGESWEDEGYKKDMARLNPWIVPRQQGKIMVGGRGAGGRPFNRFGRCKRFAINPRSGEMERVA